MTQEIRALTVKADDLNSVPKTHIVKAENWLPQVDLWPPHVCETHTYSRLLNKA